MKEFIKKLGIKMRERIYGLTCPLDGSSDKIYKKEYGEGVYCAYCGYEFEDNRSSKCECGATYDKVLKYCEKCGKEILFPSNFL